MSSVFLCPSDFRPFLIEELKRSWPQNKHHEALSLLVESDMDFDLATPPRPIAFSRQTLINAREVQGASIRDWCETIFKALCEEISDNAPWRLHIYSLYGTLSKAGNNRCQFIRKSLLELLKQKRRRLLQHFSESAEPFSQEESFVQLALTAPEKGFLSVAKAPAPFQLKQIISPFEQGEITIARDLKPPSRAFAKLVEAEMRLAVKIAAGESCVDLGASPGSWSYVALSRGAKVIAIDRSPLRDDLMKSRKLKFQKGDAFTYQPPYRVDWLICDVIAYPERSIELLLNWLGRKLTKNFVVTIKFKGTDDYHKLEILKDELPKLTCEYFLTRLCANKNEVTAFGRVL